MCKNPICAMYYVLLLYTGIRPEETKKERDEARRSLHVKGAYSAQELFDHHRGIDCTHTQAHKLVLTTRGS